MGGPTVPLQVWPADRSQLDEESVSILEDQKACRFNFFESLVMGI